MRELEKYQKTEAYKHFTRKVQEKQKGKRHRGGEIWLEKQQDDRLAQTTEVSSGIILSSYFLKSSLQVFIWTKQIFVWWTIPAQTG